MVKRSREPTGRCKIQGSLFLSVPTYYSHAEGTMAHGHDFPLIFFKVLNKKVHMQCVMESQDLR